MTQPDCKKDQPERFARTVRAICGDGCTYPDCDCRWDPAHAENAINAWEAEPSDTCICGVPGCRRYPPSAPPVPICKEAVDEIELLRATLLNIQALAERGFPIDNAKLSAQCHHTLSPRPSDTADPRNTPTGTSGQ